MRKVRVLIVPWDVILIVAGEKRFHVFFFEVEAKKNLNFINGKIESHQKEIIVDIT